MSDSPKQEEAAGVPAWVMTFADLMTLLMCFFVLMLAFSEMDAAKFKQLSGSVREAFGVQSEVEADTIPKGTSIIAQEFSPGTPRPTPMNEVRQMTMDTTKTTLEFIDPDQVEHDKIKRRLEAEADAALLREALQKEIDEGRVAVQTDGSRVIIHILEKGAFPSGYADIESSFVPVLEKIARLITGMKGTIRVAGHTDNVPIASQRFRSNWELSSARAVSVAHVLLEGSDVDPARLLITGHADTQPRVPNDNAAMRAQNRRVDVSLIRGKADQRATLQAPADPPVVPDKPADTSGDGDAGPAADAAPAGEGMPPANATTTDNAPGTAAQTTAGSVTPRGAKHTNAQHPGRRA